jgi:protein phosphatase methylesterase 1
MIAWFEGMSKRFLESSPAKLLVLAGVDRLDTELEIGRV